MKLVTSVVFLFLSAGLLLFAVACGSNRTSAAAAAPTPTANTPAPGGAGSGGASGGTGGSGGGAASAPIQYSANINDTASHSSGQLTVDVNGKGTLALKTAASSSVGVKWCNFPGTSSCFSVAQTTSDGSGNVNAPFVFPGHGNFAGVFTVTVGSSQFNPGWSIPNGSAPFQAILFPAASTPNRLGSDGAQIGVGNDPLASGSVTIAANSTIAHFVIEGALPNANYPATFCFNGGSSSCFALGVLIANAGGNGTFDIDLSKAAVGPSSGVSGVFFLHRQTDPQHAPYEYVSGLKVP